MKTAPASSPRRKPHPSKARTMLADFRRSLADVKTHLARVEEMIRRDQVTFIYVPRTKVREHTRSGHWRPYYPPLRRAA